MMKLVRMLMVGAVIAVGITAVEAQDATADKAIIANERAINEAIAKGNLAGFKQFVAADAWAGTTLDLQPDLEPCRTHRSRRTQ